MKNTDANLKADKIIIFFNRSEWSKKACIGEHISVVPISFAQFHSKFQVIIGCWFSLGFLISSSRKTFNEH